MDFWPARKELWHPLFVHFPVALLTLAALLLVLSFLAKPLQAKLRTAMRVALVFGFVGSIFSMRTGDKAEHVVNKWICDPDLTKEHEEWGEKALFLSGAGVLLGGILWAKDRKGTTWNTRQLIVWGETLAIIGAAGAVANAGHLGGKLVYELGAGVANADSEECLETGRPKRGSGGVPGQMPEGAAKPEKAEGSGPEGAAATATPQSP